MTSVKNLISEIHSLKNPEKIDIYQGFFKTGKGEYGEGDVFLGLTVPQTRGLVKKYAPTMTLDDVDMLLADKHHEVRLAGVLILVYFAEKKVYPMKELARFYMQHVSGINNWDLIDTSSEHIIGPYIQHCLTHEERVDFITHCIASSNLWINRIIVLASFHQIKQGNAKLTIYIAERFLEKDRKNREMCKNEYIKKRGFELKGAYSGVSDRDEEMKGRRETKFFHVSLQHDLIHKALGWMLREVGKRCSMDELRGFLDQYAPKMPRTMLRYAIEKMDETERKRYLMVK